MFSVYTVRLYWGFWCDPFYQVYLALKIHFCSKDVICSWDMFESTTKVYCAFHYLHNKYEYYDEPDIKKKYYIKLQPNSTRIHQDNISNLIGKMIKAFDNKTIHTTNVKKPELNISNVLEVQFIITYFG